MDRKIALPILAIVLVLIALVLLLPGGREADSRPLLPWQIEQARDGKLIVFGLTLGRSTLNDARTLLREDGELTLFQAPDGSLTAEAFFKRASLSGLRADFVFTLDIAELDQQNLLGENSRVATLGDGSRKITPDKRLAELLGSRPIRHLTYAPATRLEPELIARMFGEPDRRIEESEEVEHWIYSGKGLDIAIDRKGRVLIQYLNRDDFVRAVGLLESAR